MNDDAYTDPQQQFQSSEIIGNSPDMMRLRAQVARLLSRQVAGGRFPPILLEGETGTGKGLVARALHRRGMRSAEPFIDVDCAAIPETLLEAELFGYERGAFTDARQTKPGLFQLADRGTIFLDEIGLLPRSLQAKLLKVVEDRRVRRLGGTKSQIVDVWIITATNEDLAAATRARHFREDLYHRLAALTLRMPPLRERGDDIVLLAERFLARVSTEYGLPTKMLTADAKAAMLSHSWPGNVRELINVIERVVLLSDERIITADRLKLSPCVQPNGGPPLATPGIPARLRRFGRIIDRERLVEVLRETDWNLSLAATRLDVPRNTLRYWMVKLEVQSSRGAAPVATIRPGELSSARLPTLTGATRDDSASNGSFLPKKLSSDTGPFRFGLKDCFPPLRRRTAKAADGGT
jgi:two-component system response regulator AtoC